MKMRQLQVTILREFQGRPRREDVEIEDWEGPLISPSALSSFLACPRKWAFGALEGQYRPSTASQALGTQLHSELEYWLTEGRPPLGRLTDSGALALLPLPTTPGLECEQPFAVELSEGDRRAVLWGFRDVAAPGVVMDLKTTSALKWAKTSEDLIYDPQANIYAAACMLESGFDYADLRWVYVTTKGGLESRGVDARLTRTQVTDRLSGWFDTIHRMSVLRAEKSKKALDLEPKRTACGNYGGCEFLPQCGDFVEEEAGSGFLSLVKRKKGRETDMGIMDKVRKDLGDWKTNELANTVKPVPVRAAVTEETPAVTVQKTSATKSSLLSKVKKTKTATSPAAKAAAPVSEGINAPDAKPPVTEAATAEATVATAETTIATAETTIATAETTAVEAAPKKRGRPKKATATETILFIDCTPVGKDISVTDLSFESADSLAKGYYTVSTKYVSAEIIQGYVGSADLVVRGN